MRNNIKTIITFVSLTILTVLVILLLIYQMFMIATYDPVIEANWEEIQERAEKRSKAFQINH
ncbi:MAG: hypothetical protein WAM95_06060 [Bacillus sp. (in: firmicutes)]